MRVSSIRLSISPTESVLLVSSEPLCNVTLASGVGVPAVSWNRPSGRRLSDLTGGLPDQRARDRAVLAYRHLLQRRQDDRRAAAAEHRMAVAGLQRAGGA